MTNTQLQIARMAVCYGADTADGLSYLIDQNVQPESFNVFENDKLVQTAAGKLFEIGREYYLRYSTLMPATAALSIADDLQFEDSVKIQEILGKLKDVETDIKDAPRLIEKLRKDYKQAQTFYSLAKHRDALIDPKKFETEFDKFFHDIGRIREYGRSFEGSSHIVLNDEAENRINRMVALRANPELAKGLMTGVAGFDRDTLGLHPAEILAICGEEKEGKSALMLSMASFMVDSGKTVVIVNKEMMPELQIRRYEAMNLATNTEFSTTSNIMSALKAAIISDEQMESYISMWADISQQQGKLILIRPERSMSMDSVNSTIHEINAKHPVDCIFVDSGQKQELDEESWAQHDEQRKIAVALVNLGIRYKCPIVVDLQWKRDTALSAGLAGIGLSKGWGETISYALRIVREEGVRSTIHMIGARDAEKGSVYNMLFDPRKMTFTNASLGAVPGKEE